MFLRLLNLDLQESHLLLGARGTGKTTLLREQLEGLNTLWIDLLHPSVEDEYARDPELLLRRGEACIASGITHIVIDEVQKVPALLDVSHKLLETSSLRFVLTGSSARKLKRGGANLLAGRALANFLYPFSVFELGGQFDLARALAYGTLPKVWNASSDKIRRKVLETYALTYLKEEIQVEGLVRLLDPFRHFLTVAAQMNGKILNLSAIARDVGVDEKTVMSYFQILEDTLVGFFLLAFDTSARKRVRKSPKFYFFDTGVTRSLAKQLTIPLLPSSYAWGAAFEQFVITEMMRLIAYSGNQFDLSYLRTANDLEIDIVCDRPGKPRLLIEIKSTTRVTTDMAKPLHGLGADVDPRAELLLLSNDPHPQVMGTVRCLHWIQGLAEYFTGPDLERLPAHS